MILLTCAVAAELEFVRPGDGIATLVTGVGPVEAACAIAAALCAHRYQLVVSAGLAGSFDGSLAIGDGVIVAEDTMEIGLEDGAPMQLPNNEPLVETVYSDEALVKRLATKGFPSVRGLTVSRVTSTDETARRLALERGVQVESMEGFAGMRAAQRVGVRAIQLRGISNRCGPRASSGWNFAAGRAGLQHVVSALLDMF